MIKKLFYFWYAVGLLLMSTIGVPDFLHFSNGMFLILFAVYAFELDRKLGEGLSKILPRVFIIAMITISVEWLGVMTGFPFGSYEYTPLLGFSILGVPIAIGFAWVGVVYMAVLITDRGSRWMRALSVGACTVLLDLVLDPVAYELAFWSWEGEGGYYGVPGANFVSWFIISAFMSLLFPVRSVPLTIRKDACRLMQFMLLMFGVLSVLHELWIAGFIAAAGIVFMEGVWRYYTGRSQQSI